ncbi:hypothetical protein R3P38DRAFT_3423853 [Favolaschia claudopus]|uniref:Ubiquitin-like protease family profile domain-containing protein n=1 Tax=Favolaschia claudopus TaxID=2862362 RepID=A0AAW0D4H9_9AGAR
MSSRPGVFTIPDGPEKLFLPPKSLPVSKLIKFTLPPQRKSTVFPDASDYLSEDLPTVGTFNVAEIVIPPSIVVKDLGRAILEDPEMKSIVLIHSPAHRDKADRYPLWLATIWSILERVREAKSLWRAALDPLHEALEKPATSSDAAANIQASLAALEVLPWDGGVEGFRAGGAVDGLARWFTKDWLQTDHEDQMLELLAADLGISDGSTSCIQTTYFAQALALAYANPTTYRAATQFGWLRRLGIAFATGSRLRLGTIVNQNENHWVALTVDCEKKMVGYGDGFGGKVPAGLRRHLDWWLYEHLGAKFKWIDVPVAKQNDAHSCGILAHSALAHWFDPERFPLPECTAASMVEERIKMFLRIVKRHRQKNGGNFADDARDYDFTFRHWLGMNSLANEIDVDDEVEIEEYAPRTDSPVGSVYSESAPDDSDSGSSNDSSSDRSPSPLRSHPPHSHHVRLSSPQGTSTVHNHSQLDSDSGEEEFPLTIATPSQSHDDIRPITPPPQKRTHSERATDTPHASPVKKKLKEKIRSATSSAMGILKKGSPSKVPALFRMSGWAKVKVLTQQEKEDVFAAEADERRDKAEERAIRERREKRAQEKRRKDGQNERQHRCREKKRLAREQLNGGGKKRKVDLRYRETASRHEIAEASRPAREITKRIKEKTRHPAGRKKRTGERRATYINWMTPFAWSSITAAQRKVGWGATDIARELQRVNHDFFQHLTPSTVRGWIENVGGFNQWKPSVLARADTGNIPGHNKGGPRGILSAHPEIVEDIIAQLTDLRVAGAPLSLAVARCLIIAIITERAPELFEHRFKDGSYFRVSDSFCRKFLDKTLAWSMRKGTKAAQKLPANAEEQCVGDVSDSWWTKPFI